ncbi:hypothetical protein N7507_010927 [Penicillium longicatenatum]|nr:hypothetical protein N7507_010927 [Penicillium longicatenatum]
MSFEFDDDWSVLRLTMRKGVGRKEINVVEVVKAAKDVEVEDRDGRWTRGRRVEEKSGGFG